MADHGIETSGGLQSLRRLFTLQVDANIQAGGRGRLDYGKLLAAAKTDIGLLGGDLDISAEVTLTGTEVAT